MEKKNLVCSPVVFNNEHHTYTLNGHTLSGVTPIVAWLFPDTYQGIPYKDAQTGKTKVFTAIRTTDIEVVRKRGEVAGTQQPAPKPEPQPAPAPDPRVQTSGDGKEPLPF